MTKIYSKLEARDKALNFLITTYEDQLNESIEKYNDYMLTLAFKDIYDAAKENGVNLGNVDLLDELYFILNLCAKFSLKSQPSIYGKYGKRIL